MLTIADKLKYIKKIQKNGKGIFLLNLKKLLIKSAVKFILQSFISLKRWNSRLIHFKCKSISKLSYKFIKKLNLREYYLSN